MMEYKVVADEDIYITQTNTYGPIGESLQTAFDQFIDNLLGLIANGSLEGDIAVTLQEYGTRIRQELSQELIGIMTDRGGNSYNYQYYLKETDVFSYERVFLPLVPPKSPPML